MNKSFGDAAGPIAPDQSIEFVTTGGSYYAIPSGTHTIAAFVDDQHNVVESDESNNQLSQSVTLSAADSTFMPDLVVTNFSYANGIFTSTLINQGSAATPIAFGVGYYVDGVGRTWGSLSAPLAAGQSVNVGTTGPTYVIPDGIHTIKAFVDDKNKISEIDETNNTTSQTITVGAPAPDLIVTQFSYVNGIFNATVKNQGTAATPIAFGVGYYVDGVGRTWGSLSAPLAAGQSVNVGTTGPTYIIPNGTHTIKAFVDDMNKVSESNETNNEFSQSIVLP